MCVCHSLSGRQLFFFFFPMCKQIIILFHTMFILILKNVCVFYVEVCYDAEQHQHTEKTDNCRGIYVCRGLGDNKQWSTQVYLNGIQGFIKVLDSQVCCDWTMDKNVKLGSTPTLTNPISTTIQCRFLCIFYYRVLFREKWYYGYRV